MRKLIAKILIVAISTVAGILAFLILAWGILFVGKYPIYSDYFGVKTDLCENPGLSDGFVCQGICVDDESGKIFVSGYMKDDSPSRIYVTDKDNDSYYVSVFYGSGKVFTGHSGGIAVSGDKAYISSGDKIYQIPVSSILNANNGDRVSISKIIPVNNEASFIYADDNYIYVGEFHDGGKYVTDHPYYDPEDGLNYAIVSRYLAEDVEAFKKGGTIAPDRIYSIRNNVQGICFAEGKVVMSTSYGIADSVYYVYDEAKATDSGMTLDGAPIYFLGKCETEISGPAMAEGLEYYGGEVITLTESASDKYIFGKFFFANKIVSLDLLGKK